MLDAHPGHALSRDILTRFGAELIELLDGNRRPEWSWFEIVLAYDNARLPEALLRLVAESGRPIISSDPSSEDGDLPDLGEPYAVVPITARTRDFAHT